MKTIYEKVADTILPKFSEACKSNKCKHPKCECGHCQRQYHTGKVGECVKINFDLTTCPCKEFKV